MKFWLLVERGNPAKIPRTLQCRSDDSGSLRLHLTSEDTYPPARRVRYHPYQGCTTEFAAIVVLLFLIYHKLLFI